MKTCFVGTCFGLAALLPTRIAFYLAATQCPTPASGSCTLTSVAVIDAAGSTDTLAVTGAATIEPPPLVTSVSPTHVLTGEISTLLVRGLHYVPGARVVLQNDDASIVGTTSTQDSSEVAVLINPSSEQAGTYDVVLTLPDSSTSIAPSRPAPPAMPRSTRRASRWKAST